MNWRPSAQLAADATRITELVLLVLGLGLVALIAAHPISSPDTFWHLTLGEIIANTGALPEQDLFSAVHPERPWVQFAWLWELAAHAVVSGLGLTGLRVAQGLLMALTYGVLYATMRAGQPPERTRRERKVTAAFFAACALLLFVDRFQARPDAPNLLLAALAAPVLLSGYRRAGLRAAAGLFALALLWANLHAGTSLLLFGSLALCAAGAALNAALRTGPSTGGVAPSAALRALGLCGVVAIAIAISPGALRGIGHFAGVFGSIIDAQEPEWSPSWVMLRYGTHPALLLIAAAPLIIGVAYAVSQVRRARRLGRAGIDFAELALCAAYLVLAAAVVRNMFLCLLPLACLLSRAAPSAAGRRALSLGALLIALLTADYATRDAYGGFERIGVVYARDLAPDTYPEYAAEFLRDARIEGKILNFPRWGDYLIWRLFPACRVLLDTRRNVTPELWDLAMTATEPEQRRRLIDHGFERYGLDLVVYEGPVFASYRPEGEWRLLFKAGPEEVYLHARSPRAAQTLARAERYYAQLGAAPGSDPTARSWIDTATRVGGERWLQHPFRAQQIARFEREIEQQDLAAKARGLRGMGLLLFRAGAYTAAVPALRVAVAHDSEDASARYHLAFALVLSGEPPAGLQLAQGFTAPLIARLTPPQRYRLRELIARSSAAQP